MVAGKPDDVERSIWELGLLITHGVATREEYIEEVKRFVKEEAERSFRHVEGEEVEWPNLGNSYELLWIRERIRRKVCENFPNLQREDGINLQ